MYFNIITFVRKELRFSCSFMIYSICVCLKNKLFKKVIFAAYMPLFQHLEAKAGGFLEFRASLVYILSSRTASTMYLVPSFEGG